MESGRRKLHKNPRQTASVLSIIFFGWSIPIFKRTYDKSLDANDANEPLTVDRSSELGDRIERYAIKFRSIERKLMINEN